MVHVNMIKITVYKNIYMYIISRVALNVYELYYKGKKEGTSNMYVI